LERGLDWVRFSGPFPFHLSTRYLVAIALVGKVQGARRVSAQHLGLPARSLAAPYSRLLAVRQVCSIACRGSAFPHFMPAVRHGLWVPFGPLGKHKSNLPRYLSR
jgi:hypothetical protein